MDDLLKLRQFKKYSEDDVKRVVADNDKKRFALRNDPVTNRLQIRANQGHTMQVCDHFHKISCMAVVRPPSNFPCVTDLLVK